MQLSLNEIQAESRKAARGAGLSWGLAEEVGQAMAWLAERGIDAVPALLDILARVGQEAIDDDPIRIGTEIADRAQELAADAELTFYQIQQPILLLPFLAMAAGLIGRNLTLRHADGSWSVAPNAAEPAMLLAATGRHKIVAASCRADQSPALPRAGRAHADTRRDIDEALWQQLQGLAHKTYVPASEQSRRLGAGAGAIDND